MSSSSFRAEGEPTVTATLAADDGVYELPPRYGSVILKGLSEQAQTVLQEFDRNGDGEVDEYELEGVVDVLVKEQFKGRLFLCGIFMIVFSLVILLASSFGLTWAIVSVHKDTEMHGQVMVRKGGLDDPMHMANSDYTVSSSGALISRSSGSVLGTSSLFIHRPLNTNMTTRLLNTLARVMILSPSGAQVGFRVTGFAMMPTSPPQLHISTSTGVLVVVGDRLNTSESATAGLLEDELRGQGVVGVFAG